MKVYQIPHATDASACSFFFKFDIIFQYHDTLLFCNFVTHTSGTLEISMPSKCKFWDFQVLPGTFSKFLVPFLQQHIVLRSIFINFLVSFFKQQVNPASNFASFFSVVTHNYFLALALTYFGQKEPIKVIILCPCMKIHQIPHIIFASSSRFFFKFCITVQCDDTYSSITFYLILYTLWT